MTKFELLEKVIKNNPDLIIEKELQFGVEINTIDNCGYIDIEGGFIKLDRNNERISFIEFKEIVRS